MAAFPCHQAYFLVLFLALKAGCKYIHYNDSKDQEFMVRNLSKDHELVSIHDPAIPFFHNSLRASSKVTVPLGLLIWDDASHPKPGIGISGFPLKDPFKRGSSLFHLPSFDSIDCKRQGIFNIRHLTCKHNSYLYLSILIKFSS